ncbi:MAG: HBL/NHE enterotoxin family protein [Cyanobacteria bacterium P01_F01_bin.150]
MTSQKKFVGPAISQLNRGLSDAAATCLTMEVSALDTTEIDLARMTSEPDLVATIKVVRDAADTWLNEGPPGLLTAIHKASVVANHAVNYAPSLKSLVGKSGDQAKSKFKQGVNTIISSAKVARQSIDSLWKESTARCENVQSAVGKLKSAVDKASTDVSQEIKDLQSEIESVEATIAADNERIAKGATTSLVGVLEIMIGVYQMGSSATSEGGEESGGGKKSDGGDDSTNDGSDMLVKGITYIQNEDAKTEKAMREVEAAIKHYGQLLATLSEMNQDLTLLTGLYSSASALAASGSRFQQNWQTIDDALVTIEQGLAQLEPDTESLALLRSSLGLMETAADSLRTSTLKLPSYIMVPQQTVTVKLESTAGNG